MSENSVETTGATVEEAVAAGLAQLGVSPSEVFVDVIDEGNPGLFGLGARPARVRLERLTRTAPPSSETAVTQISKPYLEATPISFPTTTPTSTTVISTPPADAPPVRPERPRRDDKRSDRPAGTAPRRDGTRDDKRPDRPRGERPASGGERSGGPRPDRPNRESRPPRPNRPVDPADKVTRAQIMDDEVPAYLDIQLEDDENAAIPLLAESFEVPEAEWEEEASVGRVVLNELLERMDIRARIVVRHARPDDKSDQAPWILDIAGDHSALIGRRGDTLAALQYITRLITSRELQKRSEVIVDVNGYKARRARSLYSLATRMADEAVQRQRTVALEPMPPHERRIIHLALRGRADVQTKSIGEGPARKVTIVPRTSGGQAE